MTAGVQSFEPTAAYLPSQANPSAQTTAATKADGDKTGAGADGVVSDFQSVMDLQQAAPEPKSSGCPQADSEKKTGSSKTTGKKQNAPPGKVEEAAALAAAIPVQVVEAQRPILPITFVPGQPHENADTHCKANDPRAKSRSKVLRRTKSRSRRTRFLPKYPHKDHSPRTKAAQRK